MTDRTWRCSTCANEHDETMPHDTDRASAERLPQHSYECAAQPDDEDCICGVSDAYALGLRDGAAMTDRASAERLLEMYRATEESRQRGYKTVVVALDDLTTLLAALLAVLHKNGLPHTESEEPSWRDAAKRLHESGDDEPYAEECPECQRQERLLGADPTEEWVADAWSQATPHPHATIDDEAKG